MINNLYKLIDRRMYMYMWLTLQLLHIIIIIVFKEYFYFISNITKSSIWYSKCHYIIKIICNYLRKGLHQWHTQ